MLSGSWKAGASNKRTSSRDERYVIGVAEAITKTQERKIEVNRMLMLNDRKQERT